MLSRFQTCWIGIAAVITASVSPLHADHLALYDFEGDWLKSYAAASGVTAGNFFWSATGLTQVTQATKGDNSSDPFPTSAATGFDGWGPSDYSALSFRSVEAAGTSEAGAIANNDYVAFAITPHENVSLNLSLLEFKLSMSGTSGANTFFVRSSLDNYGTTLLSGTITTNYQKFSINLAELGFVNISQTVQFRIYFYTPGAVPSGSASNYVDKVLLQGTAIPEPNGFILLTAAGALFLLCRSSFGGKRA